MQGDAATRCREASGELGDAEEALTAVLILSEGLDVKGLSRARLTLAEVGRQLRRAATCLCRGEPSLGARIAEIDAEAWTELADGDERDFADAETCYRAICGLVPDTLTWLRAFRRSL